MARREHRGRADVLHQLDRVRDQARAGVAVLERELPALSVEETSPDGAVSLSVDANGVLTSLRLGHQVRGMSPAAIANAVLHTYVLAQRRSATHAAELLRPFGEHGYLQDQLRWRQEFRPPAQDENGSAKRVVHRVAPADVGDEDFEFRMKKGW
jgi:hypothetical protein